MKKATVNTTIPRMQVLHTQDLSDISGWISLHIREPQNKVFAYAAPVSAGMLFTESHDHGERRKALAASGLTLAEILANINNEIEKRLFA